MEVQIWINFFRSKNPCNFNKGMLLLTDHEKNSTILIRFFFFICHLALGSFLGGWHLFASRTEEALDKTYSSHSVYFFIFIFFLLNSVYFFMVLMGYVTHKCKFLLINYTCSLFSLHCIRFYFYFIFSELIKLPYFYFVIYIYIVSLFLKLSILFVNFLFKNIIIIIILSKDMEVYNETEI